MVLMAIDHASFFIARIHPAETWASGPPYYATTIAFVTRWVTHLCAPGFFLLMGAGMAMFATSRRAAGWSRARVTRFLVTRGAVLLVVQHVVENPAWLLGILSASAETPAPVPFPGEQGDVYLSFAVITALGVSMIVWGYLIEAPSAVVLVVSVAAIVASMVVTPGPGQARESFSMLMRLLFIPGQTGFATVMYPPVPWLAPAGFGILLARAIARKPSFVETRAAAVGALLVATFIVLRTAGLGEYHEAPPGLIGFLSLTKYPPSLDFLLVTLGVDLILLVLCTRPMPEWFTRPLQVFGQVPLFFYLLHLYVFGALSWLFRTGASFGVMYLIWAAALGILYPACRWYARFKASRPMTSLWRLL